MDIVVKGHQAEVTDRFRTQAEEKLKKLSRLDGKVTSLDVELSNERNPRQADRRARVEITVRSRGPVIRAEACAADPFSALDAAAARLETRMRKAADRRRVHHGRHTPISVAEATATLSAASEIAKHMARARGEAEPIKVDGEGPLVVREKTHRARPMSLEQALYEMELVGHDFYLFVDRARGLPAVVYRRRGYDYGVIHLDVEADVVSSDGKPSDRVAGSARTAAQERRAHAALTREPVTVR
jgi:ribosomal subunit interface protein